MKFKEYLTKDSNNHAVNEDALSKAKGALKKEEDKIKNVLRKAPKLSNLNWVDVMDYDVDSALKTWDRDEYADESGNADEADELDDLMNYVQKHKKEYISALEHDIT